MSKLVMLNGSPDTYANIAFDYAVKAKEYRGSATQTMAYVLRQLHASFMELQRSGINGMCVSIDAPIEQNVLTPTWEQINKGGESLSLFLKACKVRLMLLPILKQDDESELQALERENRLRDRTQREALIKLAIPLACALEKRAIPMADFQEVKIGRIAHHMWRVPMSALLKQGEACHVPTEGRFLNGKSVAVWKEILRDGNTDRVPQKNRVASIETFLACAYPKVSQTQPAGIIENSSEATAGGNGASDVVPVSVKTTGNPITDFNSLVLETDRIISAWEDDDELPMPDMILFPADVQSAMAHIAAFYDAMAHAKAQREVKAA